jgi:putative tricarboxylic transport membrane protein
VVGGVFFWHGADLESGSAMNMGPGFMPRILCGLLLLVGFVLIVRAARMQADPIGAIRWRPLVTISAAILLFAVTLRGLGLAITTVLTIGVSSLSIRYARPIEITLVAVGMAVFAVGLFVVLLKLDIPIWPTGKWW